MVRVPTFPVSGSSELMKMLSFWTAYPFFSVVMMAMGKKVGQMHVGIEQQDIEV